RLLFKKSNGALKKSAPNAYMLFRLERIKIFKGKRIPAIDITTNITGAWWGLSQDVRDAYKRTAHLLQGYLDFLNTCQNSVALTIEDQLMTFAMAARPMGTIPLENFSGEHFRLGY
ncbi:hypothetical protein LPJ61_006961, partial [Coemansia biformis]